MTRKECAIVSAYTGILCGSFNDFHKYAEELMGRPIWTHEFVNKDLTNELKRLSKNDFCNLGKSFVKKDRRK